MTFELQLVSLVEQLGIREFAKAETFPAHAPELIHHPRSPAKPLEIDLQRAIEQELQKADFVSPADSPPRTASIESKPTSINAFYQIIVH